MVGLAPDRYRYIQRRGDVMNTNRDKYGQRAADAVLYLDVRPSAVAVIQALDWALVCPDSELSRLIARQQAQKLLTMPLDELREAIALAAKFKNEPQIHWRDSSSAIVRSADAVLRDPGIRVQGYLC